MKYELHCHSVHSHGKKLYWEAPMKPEQIIKALKKKGFTGAAITDHDSIKSWTEAKRAAKKHDMVFIPGVEVTTASGHLLAEGISEKIRSGMTVEETVDAVHDQGGIAIAPHPFDLRGEGIGEEFMKCDAAEVFNSLNLSRLENRIARNAIENSGVPAVVGSDAHCFGMLGRSVNHIDAQDMDAALKMIKKGAVRFETSYVPVPVVVSWARERMRLSYDGILEYMEKNYSPPRRRFAKFMLDRFVSSRSPLWDGLGYFSIGVSVLYSYLRMVTGI